MEKTITIKDIEALTQSDAESMTEEKLNIKGHTIYFIDFGGHFGYSAIVFADGMHIHYANDYALHHSGKARDELKEWYIDEMNNKLFTESELLEPTSDPSEIKNRKYFLQNYYGMRRPHVSIFAILRTEEERAAYNASIAEKVMNPICLAYYDDIDFVQHCVELYEGIEQAAKANENNFDYWRDSFLYEMYNHEYGINWQADYDVISCYANVDGVKDYEDREKLFNAAGFSELQRNAYHAALKEYNRKHR